jgi:hypothetical protein
MRYTLWNHGVLVGHTDLDIHTVTSTMRQGFVEPTEEGRLVLVNETGVWRAIAQMKRERRERGETRENDDHTIVLAAMERRAGHALELRDETGAVFECEFIRITDLIDMNDGVVDEMSDTEEEEEAAFQMHLASLSSEQRQAALTRRAEMEANIKADIETLLEEMHSERDEQEMFGSAWPPPEPEDARWNTMQYLLQAHLKAPAWDDAFGDLQLPM